MKSACRATKHSYYVPVHCGFTCSKLAAQSVSNSENTVRDMSSLKRSYILTRCKFSEFEVHYTALQCSSELVLNLRSEKLRRSISRPCELWRECLFDVWRKSWRQTPHFEPSSPTRSPRTAQNLDSSEEVSVPRRSQTFMIESALRCFLTRMKFLPLHEGFSVLLRKKT